MTDEETGPELTFVDDYEVSDVAEALRAMAWSDKARTLVKALALAPNRALSRFEMARTIGSNSVNATNSVLGHFAKALALELDPDLETEWKPSDGRSRGDWVMFACVGGRRIAAPTEGEPDVWVFVMRDTLALALQQIGFADYHEISDDAAEAMWPDDDDDESNGPSEDPTEDIESVTGSGELDDLTETERKAVISARVGQGRFREELLDRWEGCCAVTGTTISAALVASHIKPWALCSNSERVDPANGLLLVGTLDRLFDYGLISFDAAGRIMLSPRIPPEEYARLHLTADLRLRALPPETAAYLVFHRDVRFLANADDEYDDDGSAV